MKAGKREGDTAAKMPPRPSVKPSEAASFSKAPPAGETEAGKEARAGVPIVLDARPAFGERGVDPGIEAQPVDVLALAAPEEPVTQGLRLNCRAALRAPCQARLERSNGSEKYNRARRQDRHARDKLTTRLRVIYTAFAGPATGTETAGAVGIARCSHVGLYLWLVTGAGKDIPVVMFSRDILWMLFYDAVGHAWMY